MNDDTEAERLEDLWAGEFGDDYVKRNEGHYEHRGSYWNDMLDRYDITSALEVGCNIGGNLEWLQPRIPEGHLYGIDVNHSAIAGLNARLPTVNAIWSPGRDLPFRDKWFDVVFTMGVLIHQPESTLPLVMAEMARCTSRYVLMGEYYSENTVEVPYRGHDGALFKRDYGRIFGQLFPHFELLESGFLSKADGWDDVTWWIFQR